MVDAVARSAPSPVIEAQLRPWSEEAWQGYRALADSSPVGAAQHPIWVEAWRKTRSADLVFLQLRSAGQLRAAMPLEVQPRNGLRIARALGGSHASGNFPATAADFHGGNLPRGLSGSTLGIDLILIERQAPELSGRENPFATLPRVQSPNLSLAVDLQPGFEAVLDRIGRKRRLKKHRSQMRKLEAAGGYKRVEARSEAEIERLLSAFLLQKAERFQRLGIGNVFLDMEPFLLRLFVDAAKEPNPPFVLHGLEVGGKLRAVTGSTLVADRVICEFSSIVEDELVHASPGDFLFFENIRAAADSGASVFDFSVGDELYKRGWCDLVSAQFDTIVPLTVKGHALAALLRASAAAKRRIKNNERLWQLIKRLRQGRSAPPAEKADDADG
jgi:CelD/BcsL family acetyltransferase involved in cellulose biosynthesis